MRGSATDVGPLSAIRNVIGEAVRHLGPGKHLQPDHPFQSLLFLTFSKLLHNLQDLFQFPPGGDDDDTSKSVPYRFGRLNTLATINLSLARAE